MICTCTYTIHTYFCRILHITVWVCSYHALQHVFIVTDSTDTLTLLYVTIMP